MNFKKVYFLFLVVWVLLGSTNGDDGNCQTNTLLIESNQQNEENNRKNLPPDPDRVLLSQEDVQLLTLFERYDELEQLIRKQVEKDLRTTILSSSAVISPGRYFRTTLKRYAPTHHNFCSSSLYRKILVEQRRRQTYCDHLFVTQDETNKSNCAIECIEYEEGLQFNIPWNFTFNLW